MGSNRFQEIWCVVLCAIVATLSVVTASGQFGTPSQADALSAAAKANPELAEGLAKELGSTPEQAAGAAGVIFGIAKSFLTPEDFAQVSKAVPGMDTLLAAAPAAPTTSSSALTPGFASSSTPGVTMAVPQDAMTSAFGGLSKLGIKPEMIAKALPYLSGYLKKYGGAAIGSVLGGVFKSSK